MIRPSLQKLTAAIALAFAAASANAASLATGDIAFTALNADEDGWSLVTFVDIDANTQIYFSDGTASTATTIGATESAFSWNTGASVIAAGTVVRFSAIDVAARAASVGTFAVVNSTNLGLSATAETIYAFLGTSATNVTTMLSAASTEANTASLTTVGLTAGSNAIKLTSSTDYAAYTGARSGAAAFADYATAVNNTANWAINVGGDGSPITPDTTNFTTATPVPVPAALPLLISGFAGLVGMRRRRTAALA